MGSEQHAAAQKRAGSLLSAASLPTESDRGPYQPVEPHRCCMAAFSRDAIRKLHRASSPRVIVPPFAR